MGAVVAVSADGVEDNIKNLAERERMEQGGSNAVEVHSGFLHGSLTPGLSKKPSNYNMKKSLQVH